MYFFMNKVGAKVSASDEFLLDTEISDVNTIIIIV